EDGDREINRAYFSIEKWKTVERKLYHRQRVKTHETKSTMGKKGQTFPKAPTGISGLDEITDGGFPKGRPVLICGSAGCGKTLLATQFLVKGITENGEPGVFMSFEESAKDL